jgi:cell division transport system ATP-binding protein
VRATLESGRHPTVRAGKGHAVIRFENVSKVYERGARPALDDVSVDVERGEFVFLVGASGSGKSTFLRLVLREERPTGGRVYVAGRDLTRLSSWRVPGLRRGIGMVFQDFRLLPNKTVYENVAFALQVIGRPRHVIRSTVPEVLEWVGLDGKERRRPHELSGGEQQRVAIARAFVNRPPILLADEPTGNLDPTTSLGIMRLLDRINRTGTTVVMATHDDEIVNEMRRRVVELSTGHVVRDEAEAAYGRREEILPAVGPAPGLDAPGRGVPTPRITVQPEPGDVAAERAAEEAAEHGVFEEEPPPEEETVPSRRTRGGAPAYRSGDDVAPDAAAEVVPPAVGEAPDEHALDDAATDGPVGPDGPGGPDAFPDDGAAGPDERPRRHELSGAARGQREV